MEAVVCTDWHLDLLKNIMSSDPEQGIKLQFNDIEKPFKYAVANGVKNVIVPGDIGQADELSSTAKYYLLELLMKYDGILNIYMIPGNHDYDRLGVHSLKLFELLVKKNKFTSLKLYVKPTKVKIDGEKFYFLPFPFDEGKLGYVNVAHIEVAGAVRDNGNKIRKGTAIKEGTSWIIGHLHQYQVLPNVLYCGTLHQNNFGEKLPKGFVHIRVKKGVVKHKFIEIEPSFKFLTVNIDEPEDWAKISRVETEFHRVYVNSAMAIPDEIRNYTNVIQISGKIKEGVVGGDDSEVAESEDLQKIEEDDDHLRDYLKSSYQFDKKQIKRSLELIHKARANLAQIG